MFTNLSSRRGPFLLFVLLLALSAGRAFANDAQVWAALGQGGKVVLLRHTHVDMGEGIGHLAPETARPRAETFVAHETPPTLQTADREPTKLAVFAFELEDTSAAVHSIGESTVDAADAAELTRVTDAVRQMLAQSPHYRVIDVGGADADAVKAHVLHDCGGCDAGIAPGPGRGSIFGRRHQTCQPHGIHYQISGPRSQNGRCCCQCRQRASNGR